VDLGPPVSYLVLEKGTPVYSSDGQKVGTVEHVLGDADADVFDGVIVDTSAGPGGHRFVDAPHVDRIHEDGVVLSMDGSEAEDLPEPAPGPGELDVNPADAEESPLQEKLRRAWDYLSGNY
jgi:hypothetical protein